MEAESYQKTFEELYSIAESLGPDVFNAGDIAQHTDMGSMFVSNRLHEMCLRDSYDLHLVQKEPFKIYSTEPHARTDRFEKRSEGYLQVLNALSHQEALSGEEIRKIACHFNANDSLSARLDNMGLLEEQLRNHSKIEYMLEKDEYIWQGHDEL